MLKQFLENHPTLWTLSEPLRKLRNLLFFRKSKSQTNYTETVLGGELLLRLRNIKGAFYIPATSDLARRIVLEGAYEPEVTTALEEFSNLEGCLVNVGANIGLFAAYFAHAFPRIEKVIAIEPNPEAFAYLSRNIALNNLGGRVDALNVCVGADEKEVEFFVVDGKPEYSSVNGIIHPSVADKEVSCLMVAQKPLRDLTARCQIGLIFVDVEGAEEQVFRGAEEILKEQRPILFFECSNKLLRKFGGSSQSLEHYLTSLGYDLRDALRPGEIIKHPYEGEVIATHLKS